MWVKAGAVAKGGMGEKVQCENYPDNGYMRWVKMESTKADQPPANGAFKLEESRIRDSKALERLYLVVALAILFATSQGTAVQITGLRTQVDPHWKRGLSYLKIGLR